jgi:Flp pilus assembly pilin Flp
MLLDVGPGARMVDLVIAAVAVAQALIVSEGERTMQLKTRGQGLAEYALILALIAIVAIIALVFLGGQLKVILSTVGTSI